MIAQLVIGSPRGLVGEVSINAEQPRRFIESQIYRLHRDLPQLTVCTYSPMVMRAVLDAWRMIEPHIEKREAVLKIVLRGHFDTRLSNVKDPDWLCAFALEDLYLHGEFDRYLEYGNG